MDPLESGSIKIYASIPAGEGTIVNLQGNSRQEVDERASEIADTFRALGLVFKELPSTSQSPEGSQINEGPRRSFNYEVTGGNDATHRTALNALGFTNESIDAAIARKQRGG